MRDEKPIDGENEFLAALKEAREEFRKIREQQANLSLEQLKARINQIDSDLKELHPLIAKKEGTQYGNLLKDWSEKIQNDRKELLDE